jgi:HD-like signal output (HDOD) protein
MMQFGSVDPGVATKIDVLFVDDEAPILEGLRNRLRKQRTKWNLSFALGGPAAVELIAKQRFDVIVTDMRMPVIDGAELLKRVHREQPHAVRIVLSGQADMDSVLRVLPIAHRYLSKPCSLEDLEYSIERASQLARRAQSDNVRKLAGNVRALPPAPHLFLELSSALADKRVGIPEVAKLVGRDLAMSAKVLQIVNSAFFGSAQKIGTVERAVSYLGIDTIQALVLGAEVFRPNPSQPAGVKAAIERAQSKGLATGRLAMKFFDVKAKAQEAFLAGMMHDVGDLVLLTAFGSDFETIPHSHDGHPIPREERETEQFGASHADVGAHLLGLWGLPNTTAEAAAYHHRPRDLRHDAFDIVDAVHVAHELIDAASKRNVRAHNVDVDLLKGFGVSGKLPEWCALAHALFANAEESDE